MAIKIIKQPMDFYGLVDSQATFSVEAIGEGLTYQWYFRRSVATDWTKWEGNTSSSASIVASENLNGLEVMCKVRDVHGTVFDTNIVNLYIGFPVTSLAMPDDTNKYPIRDANAITENDLNGAVYEALNEPMSDVDTIEGVGYDVAVAGNSVKLSMFGGRTQKWNQMIMRASLSATTDKGVTYYADDNGYYHFSGTSEETINVPVTSISSATYTFIENHKYFAFGCPVGGNDTNTYRLWIGSNIAFPYGYRFQDWGGGVIATAKGTETVSRDKIYISIFTGYTANNLVFKPSLIDLTEIYGAGNEPTSVDDERIKWLEAYALEHPEFDSGSLVSANVDKIESVTDNLWIMADGINTISSGGNFTAIRKDGVLNIKGSTNDSRFVLSPTEGVIYVTGHRYDTVLKKEYSIRLEAGTYYAYAFPNGTIDVIVRLAIGNDGDVFINENQTDFLNLAGAKTITIDSPKLAMISLYSNKASIDYNIKIMISKKPITAWVEGKVIVTYPIPTEIQQLDGYGLSVSDDVYNYIDLERKKFIKRVASVDLGDLEYTSNGETFVGYLGYDVNNSLDSHAIVSANWEFIAKTSGHDHPDKAFHIREKGGASLADPSASINVRDNSISNTFNTEGINKFKDGVKGIILNFELATPEEIDISQYISNDIYIEADGSMIYNSDSGLAVPYKMQTGIISKLWAVAMDKGNTPSDLILTDDVTGEQYKIGISSGKFYISLVNNAQTFSLLSDNITQENDENYSINGVDLSKEGAEG